MKVKKLFPLFLLLVSIAVLGITVYQSVSYDYVAIETNLADIEPVFLIATLFLIIFFLAVNFRDIKKVLGSINRNVWILLLIILLIGLFIRVYAPHTHRVYFDEDIYLDIGKEILVNGKGSLCNYGTVSECYEYDLMKWPNGYPMAIAISYFFFGIGENTAFGLVTLLGTLSIFLIFLIAYMFSEKEKVALFAALLFALIPVHIMWSATAASEPVFVFFTLLAFFSFIFASKTNDWKAYALAGFSLVYALQIRTEGVILIPIMVCTYLLFDKNRWKNLLRFDFVVIWVGFLVLIAPYLVHTYYSFLTDPWGSSDGKFGLQYLERNLPENSWFWVAGYPTIEHPLLYTILLIPGIIYLFRNNRILLSGLGIWFFFFFILYVLFYAGSVRYGVDVRYALTGYPAYTIISAYGMYALTRIRFSLSRYLPIILSGVVLASFVFYLPSIMTPAHDIGEARQARLYHDHVLVEARALASDCYIMSHVPSMYLVNGNNALQVWFGQNQEVMDEIFSKTDCVVFDDGFWCWVEPYKSSVCKHMFDGYVLENITSIEVDRKNYGLYYVKKT